MGGERIRIEKIDLPDDGYGIFTYLERYKYPYKGYPNERIVHVDSTFKRAIVGTIKLSIKRPFVFPSIFFGLLIMVSSRKVKKKVLFAFSNWIGEMARTAFKDTKYFEDHKRLCRSGREIYRVGMKFVEKIQDQKEKNAWEECLIGLVMMWEYDNAYRFRGQDFFGELNKTLLKQNPRKEIIRLLKLGLSRERSIIPKDIRDKNVEYFDLGDKWNLVTILARVILSLQPKLAKRLGAILSELNLEEIRLDEGDWYWVCERWDYDFGGKTYEERKKERDEIDEQYWKTLPPPKLPDAQVMLTPNDLFFSLDRPKAEELINNLLKQLWGGYEQRHSTQNVTSSTQ